MQILAGVSERFSFYLLSEGGLGLEALRVGGSKFGLSEQVSPKMCLSEVIPMKAVLVFKHSTKKSTDASFYENELVSNQNHVNSSGASLIGG